jgi:hypothetical protein
MEYPICPKRHTGIGGRTVYCCGILIPTPCTLHNCQCDGAPWHCSECGHATKGFCSIGGLHLISWSVNCLFERIEIEP